jgi:hypothetical protein
VRPSEEHETPRTAGRTRRTQPVYLPRLASLEPTSILASIAWSTSATADAVGDLSQPNLAGAEDGLPQLAAAAGRTDRRVPPGRPRTVASCVGFAAGDTPSRTTAAAERRCLTQRRHAQTPTAMAGHSPGHDRRQPQRRARAHRRP